jgi:hypothetical protein
MRPIPPPLRSPGIVFVCLLAFATGCGMYDTLGTPSVPGGKTDLACTVDQDCADPALFFCNTALSRCEPSCRTDADCAVTRRGEIHAITACESREQGCRCDANRCVAALCAGDDACEGGQVCRDGACVAPPRVSTATACRVVPERVVAPMGASLRFEAWVSAGNEPLVPGEGLTWAAVSPRLKGGGQGLGATFTLVTSGPAEEAVEARVGNVTCRARVTVLPRHEAQGRVRVVATDGLTGYPVEGATVVVADATGTPMAKAVTDVDGVAVLVARSGATVSVFHADFGYLTVGSFDMDGSRDLRLPLRRNPADREGGVRVALVDSLPALAKGALTLGFTGLSVPGLLSDSVPRQVQGPDTSVELTLGGASRRFAVPTNFWLGGLGAVAPESVGVPGIAGVCDGGSPGVLEPEEAIRTGACGTRTAWALTAQAPSSELPPGMMDPLTDPTLLLVRALPPSGRFFSTLTRDVRFPLRAGVQGLPGADGPLTPLDLRRMPLAFPFVVRLPALPRFRGSYLERALVLGTVTAPGRGTVPLGLGAAVNINPVDPNTDAQGGFTTPGFVRMRMAPAHDGLEGQAYRLVALASSGAATSTTMSPLDAPRFDPDGASPVVFPGHFPAIPEGARYNFDAAPWNGLSSRQWRMAGFLPGTSLLRATFTNGGGRRWSVWLDALRSYAGVRLPLPPEGFEDRTFLGDVEGSRAAFFVEGLSVLSPDGDPTNLSELAEAGNLAPEALAALTTGVSTLDYGRAQVTWLLSDGAVLAPGASVLVKVEGFRPGPLLPSGEGEGGVLFTVRGGGVGCDGVRALITDATPTGEVRFNLPQACAGGELTLVATLVDPLGEPLRPAVTAARTVRVP